MSEFETSVFKGGSVNHVVQAAITDCLNYGTVQESRNGKTLSLYDATMVLTDPLSRNLNLSWRKSNIFQLMFETLWVLAGEEKLDKLEVFLPRAKDYSDDGETWHDAYGPRLMGSKKYGYHNQLQDAFKLLNKDLNTRRAFVSIFDPRRDTDSARKEKGVENPKAIPCNDGIFFWVEQNKLMMKVVQRSGDLFFGAGSINLFEFSVIHEIMHELLKVDHPELQLGEYRHNTMNLHLYVDMPPVKSQLEKRSESMKRFGEDTSKSKMRVYGEPKELGVIDFIKKEIYSNRIGGNYGFDNVKELAEYMTWSITDEPVSPQQTTIIHANTTTLERFDTYCRLYWAIKNGAEKDFVVEFESPQHITDLDVAVMSSPFRKFQMKIAGV